MSNLLKGGNPNYYNKDRLDVGHFDDEEVYVYDKVPSIGTDEESVEDLSREDAEEMLKISGFIEVSPDHYHHDNGVDAKIEEVDGEDFVWVTVDGENSVTTSDEKALNFILNNWV